MYSETCCWHSQLLPGGLSELPDMLSALPGCLLALPGALKGVQCSLHHSEMFPNFSQAIPWCTWTSHQRSELLRRPARTLSKGLILSWNCLIYVYTPHSLRHYWSLPVTKIHFADVCWRSFSRWVRERIDSSFAYKGSQYPIYNSLQQIATQITQHAKSKFVNAPLILVSRIVQGQCPTFF